MKISGAIAVLLLCLLVLANAVRATSDMEADCATEKWQKPPYKAVCDLLARDREIKAQLEEKTRARFAAEYGPEVAQRAVEKLRAGKLTSVRGCLLFSQALEDFKAAIQADSAWQRSLKSCADITNAFEAKIAQTIDVDGIKFHQVRLLIPSKNKPDASYLYWMNDSEYRSYQNLE